MRAVSETDVCDMSAEACSKACSRQEVVNLLTAEKVSFFFSGHSYHLGKSRNRSFATLIGQNKSGTAFFFLIKERSPSLVLPGTTSLLYDCYHFPFCGPRKLRSNSDERRNDTYRCMRNPVRALHSVLHLFMPRPPYFLTIGVTLFPPSTQGNDAPSSQQLPSHAATRRLSANRFSLTKRNAAAATQHILVEQKR